MNLKKFFQQQLELNKSIIKDPSLNDYKLTARKFLELHVKIGALADYTKCFKYWVEKDNKVSLSSLADKYMECFTRIITIGLDKNYDTIEELTVKPNDYCLSDQFLNLFIDINDLIISPSSDHYQTLLEDFLSLGISLGLSEDQINELYFNKSFCRIAL